MTDEDLWDVPGSEVVDDTAYWVDDVGVSDQDVGSAVRRGGRIAVTVLVAFAVVGLALLGLRALSSLSIPGPTSAPRGVPSSIPQMTARTTPSASHATARPTASVQPSTPEVTPPGTPAVVVSVVDGDTIHALVRGIDERVRIIGLDSPESQKPGTQVECFAAEASKAAKRILHEGQQVILQEDPTQDRRDRFGRLLAHVVLEDGTLFAEQMIREGYAVHYIYDGVPSIYADRLAAAQSEAEASEAGLWSPETCSGSPHAQSEPPA